MTGKPRGPLWADAKDVDEQTLRCGVPAFIALGLELLVPFPGLRRGLVVPAGLAERPRRR